MPGAAAPPACPTAILPGPMPPRWCGPLWRDNSPKIQVFKGFCADCGTPLTYEAPDGLALSIAAFDSPQEIEPVVQWGMEVRLPYLDKLSTLPAYTTERDPESAEFVRTMVSYQHPDHDTETWPQGHA